MNLRATFHRLPALLISIGLLSAGCADKFGESASLPPAQEYRISGHLHGEHLLSVPADAPFRITQTLRSSTGSGQAEASADPSGQAMCSVSAGADGTATGEFQLGHVIRNDTDAPVVVTIEPTVSFTHDWSVDAEAEGPDDGLVLKLVVNDSQGATHARIMLASKEDRYGPPRLAAQQKPQIDVTLKPGVSYRVLLAGRVSLSKSPRSGDATRSIALNVQRFELDIHRRKTAD